MRSILSRSVVSPALGPGRDPEEVVAEPGPFAAAILASRSRYTSAALLSMSGTGDGAMRDADPPIAPPKPALAACAALLLPATPILAASGSDGGFGYTWRDSNDGAVGETITWDAPLRFTPADEDPPMMVPPVR